jgi:hypothetical protein
MDYEVRQDRTNPEDWLVGAVDHESEGECYLTIFSGWYARERAREYADWKNSQARAGRDCSYTTSAAISSTHG